ncbi:MAG: hypothetical protein ABIX01_15160 [Chitinophagaceae bacterium]
MLFVIVCVAVAAIFLPSCQKELDGSLFTFGCKVQQWADLDSASNAVETFGFTYDSTSGKPVLLQYNDIASGNSQTVVPVFTKDTIYFNQGSYAVLDNSKRIYRLEERNSVNGIAPDGTYFYTYDATGHLATRIFDDGSNSQTTTYTFTGDELSKMDEPALGTANALTTTYTYSATTKVKDYNLFVFASNFPELRLYLPCFGMGRLTEKAIEKTVTRLNIPLLPVPEVTTTFSNYQFDTKGNITKVQLTDSIVGIPDIGRNYFSGNYLCR